MCKFYIKSLMVMLMLFGQTAFAKSPEKVLLFFHAGYCRYCEGVADSLVKIEQKYGFKIVGCGLDGKVLQQFISTSKGEDLIRKFKIASVPTLIAVDFTTGKYETLLEGYEEYNAIDAKILTWINNA